MILSQRYPTIFDGIIVADPAMRTGLSNLVIGKWIPVAFNQIAPKDAHGDEPDLTQAISDSDRKLITAALLKECDAKDGVADNLISDPLACHFDPAALTKTPFHDWYYAYLSGIICLTVAAKFALQRVLPVTP